MFPDQIKGLLAYLKDSEQGRRIVYGSDYPWTPYAGVKALSEDHDKHLSSYLPGEEDAVGTGNAKRLLAWKGRPSGK